VSASKVDTAPVLLGSSMMADDDIDAVWPRGAFWRELVPANQPCRPRSLPVEVVPLDEACFATAARHFWRLLGDLVADVLIDGVEGPWGTTGDPARENLAS
jgi:hypothetical protein